MGHWEAIMNRFRNFAFVVVLVAGCKLALATPSPTHAVVTGTTIDPGLGTLHHPVATKSKEAQLFFDQGLKLTYAFNREAAVQSFQRAAELDPNLAMAYWGIAFASGPDINNPMTAERKSKAFAAVEKAAKLESHATAVEREYIEALRMRYSADEPADRAPLDVAFKNAMAALSVHHPDDVDARVLYAESLMMLHAWKWWRPDGNPEDGTAEIVSVLQRALQAQPNHIGANHYYVHAVEMSPNPEAGIAAARRLETLAPNAGHLVHMPAHIYMRTGEYLDAARVNEAAAYADQHVHAMDDKSEYLPYYHGHNLHFLTVSYAFAGASDKATGAASRLWAKALSDIRAQPEISDYYCSNPAQVYVLFDRWSEALRMPEPPAGAPISRAFFHFARTLAFAATDKPGQAKDERAKFATTTEAIGPKDSYGLSPATDVMAVALPYLDGRLALMANDVSAAAASFRIAAAAEAKLAYDEPPDWYLASNWMLGIALLKLGDPAGAEAAFRADLQRNVAHGRSLAGLAVALRKQGKVTEADAVLKQFEHAWRGADAPVGGL